jgi:thioredoxin-like negative regulator of GroEL
MEDNPKIAEHFEVDGLPITMLYKNGVLVWSKMGILNRDELTGILRSFR